MNFTADTTIWRTDGLLRLTDTNTNKLAAQKRGMKHAEFAKDGEEISLFMELEILELQSKYAIVANKQQCYLPGAFR